MVIVPYTLFIEGSLENFSLSRKKVKLSNNSHLNFYATKKPQALDFTGFAEFVYAVKNVIKNNQNFYKLFLFVQESWVSYLIMSHHILIIRGDNITRFFCFTDVFFDVRKSGLGIFFIFIFCSFYISSKI